MNRLFNFFISIMLVGALAVGCIYLSRSYSGRDSVIRFAHDSKESSPLHQALLFFEEQVETDSNGKTQVEIYPARQLGSVRETTELVRQGNLQMTVGASVLLTSIVPEFNVLDMFYLFANTEHAHKALDTDEIGGVLLESMFSKGFHGLGFMEVGFRSVTSNKRPIEVIDDFAGLKIRAATNPVQIEAWKSLGTAPTPLSWGEVFTSLQQGLINTQESAVYSIYAERFYEAQQYLSLTEHIYTNYVWFANDAFWSDLEAEQKVIIERAVQGSIDIQRKLSAQQNKKIITELEAYGMQVNRVDDEVRTSMKMSMNRAVRETLRTKTGEPLFDRMMAEIEALND